MLKDGDKMEGGGIVRGTGQLFLSLLCITYCILYNKHKNKPLGNLALFYPQFYC